MIQQQLVPTLLTLLLLNHRVHCSMASIKFRSCIESCEYSNQPILCLHCTQDLPPPDYDLCSSSCKDSKGNSMSSSIYAVVCNKCFRTAPTVMNEVCIHACGWILPYYEDETVCGLRGCASFRKTQL